MKFPINSFGVTLAEIPNEIAFYVSFDNCQNHCFNCHSSYLWNKSKTYNTDEIIKRAKKAKEQGCSAIVLMGGTNNGFPLYELHLLINELNKILPVGLYAGNDNFDELSLLNLKWLKTGSYIDCFGGLNRKTTNQHFYEKVNDRFIDKTYLFQNEGVNNNGNH